VFALDFIDKFGACSDTKVPAVTVPSHDQHYMEHVNLGDNFWTTNTARSRAPGGRHRNWLTPSGLPRTSTHS
jgi:hypothetical protein